MYCMHCGKQIPDNAKFCPCCGGKVENTVFYNNIYSANPINRVIPNDKIQQNREIKFSSSSGRVAGGIFLIFLCIAMVVFLIFALLNIESWKSEVWKKSDKEALDTLRIVIIFFLLYFFIQSILIMIKSSAIGKTELFLTKDGICGIAGTPNYFGNINFNCKYQDVLTVTTKGTALIITTLYGNYKLLLNERDQAMNMLYQRVERAKYERNAWQNNRI